MHNLIDDLLFWPGLLLLLSGVGFFLYNLVSFVFKKFGVFPGFAAIFVILGIVLLYIWNKQYGKWY